MATKFKLDLYLLSNVKKPNAVFNKTIYKLINLRSLKGLRICLPRYIWRKVQALSCKSLATSSWAGGCIEKSYIPFNWNQISRGCRRIKSKCKNFGLEKIVYKRREDFLCCTARYWKTSMCACITGCQRFAEKLCLRFIWLKCKIWC